MAKRKYQRKVRALFTGSGSGQSREVNIGGRTFCRGATYEIPVDEFENLYRRGGFVIINKKRATLLVSPTKEV